MPGGAVSPPHVAHLAVVCLDLLAANLPDAGCFSGTGDAALPPTVKLKSSIGGKSVVAQLREALDEHSVKLIDMFREWDDDGNGAIDKKELRQAVAALGYEAPKKDVDALFDQIDDNANGWIEFEELKKALTFRPVPKRRL